jgi:hypothetical protein
MAMRKRSESPVVTEATSLDEVEAVPAELAPAVPPVGLSVTWTESDLDEAVARVKRYGQEGARSVYQMAKEILFIKTERLWTQREGGLGPKSEEAFFDSELGLSRSSYYRLIKVAEEFSADEYAALGVSRLTAILQAADKDRAKLLAKAKEGASKAELEAAARESKAAERAALPPKTDAATRARAEKRKQLIAEQEKETAEAAKVRVAARAPGIAIVSLDASVTEVLEFAPGKAVTWREETIDAEYVIEHRMVRMGRQGRRPIPTYRYTRTIRPAVDSDAEDE